jgi:Zn-dependent protease with chaperone function/Zn-finger nucleic acid-binding protein
MKLDRPLFWEIQQKQKRQTSLILFFLFLFYFFSLGLLTAGLFLAAGFFLPAFNFWQAPFFWKYLIFVFLISLVLTTINFFQARKAGATFILNRLQAYPPQSDDRYHLTFRNGLEEMGLASGLGEIKGYIIPSLNVNSLSLVDRDNRPAIAVTEGLLAEASRDELQAVIAHEVAHLLRGDTYLLTLICSLASFFEQLLSSLEREKEGLSFDSLTKKSEREVVHPFLYLAGLASYTLMTFFLTLISQKRELLADSTAVELSRDPMALARIIYKAQLANSYLGDFSLYTPLFLVPPDSREIKENFWSRLFNSHPPAITRLRLLTSMANRSLDELKDQIREQEERRERARIEARSREERLINSREDGLSPFVTSFSEVAKIEENKIWLIKTASGQWAGPYSLSSLLTLPGFSPGSRVKNVQENREGRARDFEAIRAALYRLYRHEPVEPQRQNRCPHCFLELTESFYEGLRVKTCPQCQGKLVPLSFMERILARREVGFSEHLKAKAENLSQRLDDPAWRRKEIARKPAISCPQCGLGMVVKPYSYVFYLPVYKCFHCQVIWFEADELEILQYLVESRATTQFKL